jgi:dihydroxyacetone kinase-like predicted kinase
MNPSANDVLEAARRTRAKTVVVLPNNGNVVMTAQQAANVAQDEGLTLVVVPTKTVPQGIAAQLAFSADGSAEQNAAAMQEAAGAVRTVEVTRAVRSVSLDGVDVKEGDTLGLLDDKVVASGPDCLAVARQAIEQGGGAGAELITVYRGKDVQEAEANAFVERLRGSFPKASIELVTGGQPHYDYLISVE